MLWRSSSNCACSLLSASRRGASPGLSPSDAAASAAAAGEGGGVRLGGVPVERRAARGGVGERVEPLAHRGRRVRECLENGLGGVAGEGGEAEPAPVKVGGERAASAVAGDGAAIQHPAARLHHHHARHRAHEALRGLVYREEDRAAAVRRLLERLEQQPRRHGVEARERFVGNQGASAAARAQHEQLDADGDAAPLSAGESAHELAADGAVRLVRHAERAQRVVDRGGAAQRRDVPQPEGGVEQEVLENGRCRGQHV
mmetsp:Transcript_2487/g.7649  ORF Transcript_2487/g.7649 Transcript_2487/m.7649 type:complete len:258 (-) Transcript_2487:337-1110(-)